MNCFAVLADLLFFLGIPIAALLHERVQLWRAAKQIEPESDPIVAAQEMDQCSKK